MAMTPTPGKAERVEPFWKEWTPPADLRRMSLEPLPRLVRQSWGQRPAESRTQMLYPDITLSCLGATYGRQDVPLAVDLAGPRDAARCYFLADGRGDPYGRKKYKTTAVAHAKSLHLTPFWIGAQRTCDAVGVAIYRDKDLRAPEITGLQSHLVLRRGARSIWLSGTRLAVFSAATPVVVPVPVGEPLILQYGTAAIGVRVVAAAARNGGPARAGLVDDGNPYGCLRLTVEHGLEKSYAGGGPFPWAMAALWIRTGSGLGSDAAFDAWRRAFETARPSAVRFDRRAAFVEVPGADGPVAVTVDAPFDQDAPSRIVPEPCRRVLECDGADVGRRMLTAFDVP
jgi:hypothetical protein